MKAASAMEAAATVESTSATNRAAAVIGASASDYATTVVTAPDVTPGVATSIASSIAPTRASVESAAPVSRMTPSPVIPGTSADKYSACKPPRPVEAIRRASIRIIRVVAVRAYRRTAGVALVGILVIVLTGRPSVIVLTGTVLVIVPIGVLVAATLIIVSIGVLIALPLIWPHCNSSIHLRLRVRKRQCQHGQQRRYFR